MNSPNDVIAARVDRLVRRAWTGRWSVMEQSTAPLWCHAVRVVASLKDELSGRLATVIQFALLCAIVLLLPVTLPAMAYLWRRSSRREVEEFERRK